MSWLSVGRGGCQLVDEWLWLSVGGRVSRLSVGGRVSWLSVHIAFLTAFIDIRDQFLLLYLTSLPRLYQGGGQSSPVMGTDGWTLAIFGQRLLGGAACTLDSYFPPLLVHSVVT